MSKINTEDDIIKVFQSLSSSKPPRNCLGIGDDAAVIRDSDTHAQLVTTDLLVSGVHFLLDRAAPYDLGYKALAVNVSDIAAMGGSPTYAFLSIALRSDLAHSDWVDRFSQGFADAAKRYGVVLLGGDTTRALSDVFINLTLMGVVNLSALKLRSTGRVGDLLCVTGPLGDSRAGLSVVLGELNGDITEDQDLAQLNSLLLQRHYRPTPHLQQGLVLGAAPFVHSMMDLSDGLVTDVKRLAKASGCGARIDLKAIPTSNELKDWCHRLDRLDYEYAAIGGEDYVLLFSLSPDRVADLRALFSEHAFEQFSIIGELTADSETIFSLNDQRVELDAGVFKHF
jgi:thiamine-monophosphate kinase